jgi:hypothetical protein
MWRKTADAKNPSQSSNVPEPVATAPKVGPNSPAQAIPGGPSAIAQASTHTTTPIPTPVSTQNSGASYSSPATAGNPFAAAPRASSVSVIGAGLKIQGEINGDSDLVVEGEAHGRIRMANVRAGEVAAPVTKAPVVTAPASSTPVLTTAIPTANAGSNAEKAVDAATSTIPTEADQLKSTAARGSGD